MNMKYGVFGLYLLKVKKYKGCIANFNQENKKKRLDIMSNEYRNCYWNVFV